MTEQKRTLAAALGSTPELADFIRGASQKPSASSTTKVEPLRVNPSAKRTATPVDKGLKPTRRVRPNEQKKKKLEEKSLNASRAKVAVTTRFSQSIAEALRLESLQRKMRCERLHTQQDIIELAVSSWLEKEKQAGKK